MASLRFFMGIAGVALTAAVLAVADGPKDAPKQPSQSDPKKIDKEPKPLEPKINPRDEEILRRVNLSTDGDVLLKFLKDRILPEAERPAIERMVQRFGAGDYRKREIAMRELIRRGVATLDVLRTFPLAGFDVEQVRRIDASMRTIHEADVAADVPPAAVRVLALKKPAALVETLIAYAPFADNDAVLDEIRAALSDNALKGGKADPLLVAALTDRAPTRRATAAEVLARTAFAEQKNAIRKVLADSDPLVRFQTARALVLAQERDAMPTLISTIPELPLNVAWLAEDFLLQVGAKASPPSVPMGNDPEARAKCRDAWQAWWKKEGEKVDLAKIAEPPKMLGYTLIVLLDQNTVLELGADKTPRWEVRGVSFPLDAQLISDDRLLVAEYQANRITERAIPHGNIVWQKGVIGPQVAQRLPNGNTFVVTDHQFLEFDKAGNEVMTVTFPGEGRKIMKAMKLPNGEIAAMTADARVVRYDTTGKELHSFTLNLAMRLFGGRVHMMPSGRVLVPHNAENKVVEYDSKGKAIWEVAIEQPIIASRLPNGNTLITSMSPGIGAVEVDRSGRQIWSYRHVSNTRVTRAIRR